MIITASLFFKSEFSVQPAIARVKIVWQCRLESVGGAARRIFLFWRFLGESPIGFEKETRGINTRVRVEQCERGWSSALGIVEFERATVVNLVVIESNVVLENGVPLLENDLIVSCSCLRCNKFFQITDGILWIALNSDFFTQSVVNDNFYHISVLNSS